MLPNVKKPTDLNNEQLYLSEFPVLSTYRNGHYIRCPFLGSTDTTGEIRLQIYDLTVITEHFY